MAARERGTDSVTPAKAGVQVLIAFFSHEGPQPPERETRTAASGLSLLTCRLSLLSPCLKRELRLKLCHNPE